MKAKRYSDVIIPLLLASGLLFLFLAMTRSMAAAVLADNPTVTVVHPDHSPNDLDTPIVISGTGFATISGTHMITPPLAYLGDTTLGNVTWVDSATLGAIVPWGLVPGVYTLTVVNPNGGTGLLPNAFTITQGIGVWQPNELYGGMVERVIVNPERPTTIYATASEVGFFRSDDGGDSWQFKFAGSTINMMSSPVWPDRIYMQGDYKLQRSDDGGDTWMDLGNPEFPATYSPGRMCGSVKPLPHPSITDTVYIGWCVPYEVGQNGILKSENAGQTWIPAMSGITDTQISALSFHPIDPITMYAGTAGGILYVSGNGGENWQYASRPLGFVETIAVNPFGAHEVWVSSRTGGPCETYKSANDDLTAWTPIEFEPGFSCGSITFSPFISGTVLIGNGGSGYLTTNGGDTWSPYGPNPFINNPYYFSFHPTNPNIVYMADGTYGVYRTFDGGITWEEANQGLAAVVPMQLATVPDHADLVYSFMPSLGLARGSRGGTVWQFLTPQFQLNRGVWGLAIDPFIPDRIYTGILQGVCFSTDGGQNWSETECGTLPFLPFCPDSYIGTTIIATNPGQPGALLLGISYSCNQQEKLGGIYRSTDYGETWEFITTTQGMKEVDAITYDPVNPMFVYAGTFGTGIFRSVDSGLTWEPTEIQGLEVGAIAVEPSAPSRVVAGVGNAGDWNLSLSTDHGVSWQPIPKTLEGIYRLLYVPETPPLLYAGTFYGLYRSFDQGYTWSRAAGDLGYASISALAATTADERVILYMGTHGGTIPTGFAQASDAAQQSLVGAGVYRLTNLLLNQRVYLPLVSTGYMP
jgi:photosystem II stability/assembly factor-like uncharacterized protein